MVNVALSRRRGASRASTWTSIGRDRSASTAVARPTTAIERKIAKSTQRDRPVASMSASVVRLGRRADYARPRKRPARTNSVQLQVGIIAGVEAIEKLADGWR